MKRMLTLSAAIVLLYCNQASALSLDALADGFASLKLEVKKEAEESDSFQKLYDAACRFTTSHGTDAEKKKWEKSWDDRLKTAERDNPILSEEDFSIQMLCKYFSALYKHCECGEVAEKINDETLLYASRLLRYCKEHGFSVPAHIRAYLKDDIVEKVVQFLDCRGKG